MSQLIVGKINLVFESETLGSSLTFFSSTTSILSNALFKSISSLALSLYIQHTSVYDYRKKKKKKNIALTICTFVSKLMSLLFKTPSRFVIDFLPRSKCLLISRRQSLFTVILEPKKIKSVTASAFSPP